MVKVSIIIPVYNSAIYLSRTLDSVINQTFDDFEAICINDGSTDESFKVLDEYAEKDPRINVIRQENIGAGCTRNKGLEMASGKYVYFLDSDDIIVPTFLERLVSNIENNSSDIAMFKVGNIENDKKVKIRPYFPFDEILGNEDFDNFTFDYKSVKKYVLNSSFAPWSKLYRKEFLDRHDDIVFDEKLAYEDVPFHIKVMLKASKISFVPEYLYYYRINSSNSLTLNNDLHMDIFEIVEDIGQYLTEEGYMDEFEKEYELFKLTQITQHIAIPVDEEYFYRAKDYLDGIDLDNNDLITPYHMRRFEIFYNSQTPEDYGRDIKIHTLSEENKKLEKKNRKLKKKNRKLKKEKKNQKKINKELKSSNSWKVTGPFRKISHMIRSINKKNMQEYFLKKSNSYNYYKSNYKNILKQNKTLDNRLKEYEDAYPPKECPICGYKGIDFRPYPQIIHKEVECPNCRSHERHRATWLYFQQNPQLLTNNNKFLHFAPEPQFRELFEKSDIEYHPVDVSDDYWMIDEFVDVQDIPYEDNYFDLIYCSHILEHVPDDRKAIRELYRVLKPGGTALILVPINGVAFELPYDETKTLEDESYNTPELRDKYYGQFDHVRLYGSDFKDRLIECGFEIRSDDFIKKLGHEKIERYALIRNESIFECTKPE